MTYAELKAKIDATAATGSTKIREINFTRHSAADNVVVGYDATNDEIRVVQKT
jgi:hypothetical protein